MILPAPYLYAGLLIGGFLAGGYSVHTWYKAQRVEAIEEARETERDLQDYANAADRDYIGALEHQRDHAQRNADSFRRALNAKNRELDDCRVDAELVGLLDQAGVSRPAGDPGEPRPGAAAAAPAPDSTAGAELEKCRANYAEVCVPNELQLRGLQHFTRDLIQKYNRAVGRE